MFVSSKEFLDILAITVQIHSNHVCDMIRTHRPYGCERYESFAKDEKQRLVEQEKKYEMQKNKD